jgi:hypothetical protein
VHVNFLLGWVNSVRFYHPADMPHDFYAWWAAVAEKSLETSSNVVHFSVANQATEQEYVSATLKPAASVAALTELSLWLSSELYYTSRNVPTRQNKLEENNASGSGYYSQSIMLLWHNGFT